jgi:cold shock CspA family protein
VAFKEKKEIRGVLRSADGSAKEYVGVVNHMQNGYGFIRCDALKLDVFFSQAQLAPEISELLGEGDTVRFNLAFNLLGPVAIDISI